MASKSIALAAQRTRLVAKSQSVERTLMMSAAGLAVGAAEKAGKLPVSVMGMPSKLGLGIIGHLVAMNTGGTTQRIARNIGDTCLAVYGYAAGRAGAVVAGEDDYDGD